jgi:hypothetical protein
MRVRKFLHEDQPKRATNLTQIELKSGNSGRSEDFSDMAADALERVDALRPGGIEVAGSDQPAPYEADTRVGSATTPGSPFEEMSAAMWLLTRSNASARASQFGSLS